MVHCAGILRRTPLVFSDDQRGEPDELWRVNVMGPWLLTRAAWPALVASSQGRIQVLVSMSGKRCRNVGGLHRQQICLDGALSGHAQRRLGAGIRITAICPGWVNTDMASAVQSMAPEAMTQPEDLGRLSSHLLTLPDSAVPFELAVNASLERG